MKPKPPPRQKQGNFLYQDLLEQLDSKDPLLLLAKKIPWELFERDFIPFYADFGRPAKPPRLMVGLLLLKQIENLSDERVVEVWGRNPYYQAFCGMKHFQWQFPCDPSELVCFRKRIGESGVENIFQTSVLLHGEQALEREVVIDTTVQEKNITFPTDTKLRMTKTRCISVGAKNFTRNEYDGNTLKALLSHVTDIRGSASKTAFCDRGFRGRKHVGDTAIVLPEAPSPNASEHFKRKARENFGRRSPLGQSSAT